MPKASTNRPLTMSQVAAAAGVSVPTVSKVLNQRADVAPATRERVQRVMSEYGYVINRAGRSLRKGQSGQIDFVVQSLNSEYAAEILRGVEEALVSTEMRVVLASTHDHQQRERQWFQRLADGSTDGAVIVSADTMTMHLQELRRRHIPFVVVDQMAELGPDDLSVSATNWAGGKAATHDCSHSAIVGLQRCSAHRPSHVRRIGWLAIVLFSKRLAFQSIRRSFDTATGTSTLHITRCGTY